ncbi:hypothetical protein BDR07DRAFT_723901 [Suillus spraguei]|nr:hypothetical protein BDR07DRAFT_723901 [Suillus spraguei]
MSDAVRSISRACKSCIHTACLRHYKILTHSSTAPPFCVCPRHGFDIFWVCPGAKTLTSLKTQSSTHTLFQSTSNKSRNQYSCTSQHKLVFRVSSAGSLTCELGTNSTFTGFIRPHNELCSFVGGHADRKSRETFNWGKVAVYVIVAQQYDMIQILFSLDEGHRP